MHHRLIQPAKVTFTDGVPVAAAFSDSYFSRQDGLAETRYTFLGGNHLPQAWSEKSQFTILETGFGSGLNAFATFQAWQQHRPAGGILHFVSVEAHPMQPADMRQTLASWPELHPWMQWWLADYPPMVSGFHRRWHRPSGICLTVIHADVLDGLSALEAQADCVYLDGFAPRQNRAMWSQDVFQELHRLTRPDATLATFTAAGFVRRGLRQAGFQATKRDGFGRKREHLVATRDHHKALERVPPWFAMPQPQSPPKQIHGAGIGGAALAMAWRQRSIDIPVLESDSRCGASRNRRATLAPRLPGQVAAPGQLLLACALYAQSVYERDAVLVQRGAWMLENPRFNQQQMQQVLQRWQLPRQLMDSLDQGEPIPQTELQASGCGLWLGMGGLVDTRACLENWIGETTHTTCSGRCMLATGAALLRLGLPIPLHPRQGEVVYVKPESGPALGVPVVGKGMLAVVDSGCVQVGATFNPIDDKEAQQPQKPDAIQQQKLLQAMDDTFQDLRHAEILGGNAGIRVRSADRQPVAGPVPDADEYRARFSALQRNNRAVAGHTPCYQSDWVLGGLGSHGYTFAPLLAELMVSQWRGEPWPIPRDQALLVHPARFLARRLKRGD